MGISKSREKGFSQKAFVFNTKGKFLAMRRTATAPSNPLKWDLPGGNVEFGEDLFAAMRREIKEETGLIAKTLIPFDREVHISPLHEHWTTMAYKTFTARGKLSISSEHDLYKWVTLEEFLKLKATKKLKKFARTLKKTQKA